MTSSTTFKVSDVEVKSVRNFDENEECKKTSICSQLKAYSKNHCTDVLMETQFSSNVRASRNNGFINTVVDCYNNHNNLVIRPDDIWTAILTQFSFYINKNAEEFRGQFVNFQGKKELVVQINGLLHSAPYDLFVTKMTETIDENLVDKTVKDWVLPNFTTTAPNDVVTCGIILMATTKKYFDFECCLMCGIPNVTLEGTVKDWENILNRVEKLKAYKLDKWYDMLRPILQEFVAAKKNNVNVDFWNRICHYLGGGSGPTFMATTFRYNLQSGWLTAFAVFDEDGEWRDDSDQVSDYFFDEDLDDNVVKDSNIAKWPVIDIAKIPSGIVTVDVKISDQDGDHESIMFAGHIAYEILEGNRTLKPQIGWGMNLKSTSEEVEKMHEIARGEDEWYCDVCNVCLNE